MDKKAEWGKIYSDDGILQYEGFTLIGKPYGAGTTFFSNGNKYQEGIFDIKGLLYGREYYPSGQLRFEGIYRICKNYGPNYPIYGNCYDENGLLYYVGQIKLRFGGVGYPSVVVPEQFGPIPQAESRKMKIKYFMWADAKEVGINY